MYEKIYIKKQNFFLTEKNMKKKQLNTGMWHHYLIQGPIFLDWKFITVSFKYDLKFMDLFS